MLPYKNLSWLSRTLCTLLGSQVVEVHFSWETSNNFPVSQGAVRFAWPCL